MTEDYHSPSFSVSRKLPISAIYKKRRAADNYVKVHHMSSDASVLCVLEWSYWELLHL